MGLFSSMKDRREIARLRTELAVVSAEASARQRAYAELVIRWNALVSRVNLKGGEQFLDGKISQSDQTFTQAEIKQLLKLCHPDRHAGSEASNEMTRRLLELRK